MSLTETGESLLQIQEEAEPKAELSEPEAESPEVESPEAELPVSSEALVPVLPVQKQDGQKASLEHSGRRASTSLPNLPSASGNATGGHTLALQSSWTGKVRSPYFSFLAPECWRPVLWSQCLGHEKACAIWKMLPPCLPPCMD